MYTIVWLTIAYQLYEYYTHTHTHTHMYTWAILRRQTREAYGEEGGM